MTTPHQPSLFDYGAANARQADGLSRAVEHSGAEWQDYATAFVRVYLLHHRELFVDDVWLAGLERPASPRAFGQVMKHALRHEWIAHSGSWRRSASSNNTMKPVYRSRIYAPSSTATYPRPAS